MIGLLNIASTATTLPGKQFTKLLNGFENHQSFSQRSSSELDAIVSLITNCLNSNGKKYEGLLLLKSFQSQCQLDIIEQKGGLWISLCTKICVQKKPAAAVCLAYEVIADLLVRSVHIPELGKSISSNLLCKIIESVNGLSIECHLAAMQCLETCMKLYAGPCGSSRAIIDRFLGNFIDSSDKVLVVQAAKCLHLLQQVRGGNAQGLSQKSAWSLLQTQLLGSLHAILDQIYANTAETYDGHGFARADGEATALKTVELNLSAEPVARAAQLVVRFQNLCEYLRIALCEPFPVAKSIQPGKIFSVISRGLAVNCSTLSTNLITDNVAVGALLPQIHVLLFQLLDSLILLLGSNLLPFANDICQLITQSLKWTSSGKAAGFKRPYISIRQSAYQTLELWCKTTKYGSLVESISDDLIKSIIQDITPYQSEVTLKVLSGSRKYLSKKARQRLQKAQNDASNIAQTHSKAFNPHNTKIIYTDNGNEPLCSAALSCLNQMILVAGCFLKPVYQKILQENIVAIAFSAIGSVPKQSNLYYTDECRGALYSALYALVMSPHHLCPPPVQYATQIFSIAQTNDISSKVREQCSNYLRSMEKILHPQKETFYFPTDVNEVAEVFKKDTDKAKFDIAEIEPSDEDDEDIEINISETVTFSDSPAKTLKQIMEEPIALPQLIELPPEKFKPQNTECAVELTKMSVELPLPSPPRKSARLNVAHGSSTERDSPVKPESPSPRRKSARLSSISLSELSPSKSVDTQNKKLSTVDETKTSSDNKCEPNTEGVSPLQADKNQDGSVDNEHTSNQNEDDLVNELAAAFVDEFIDLDDDSTE